MKSEAPEELSFDRFDTTLDRAEKNPEPSMPTVKKRARWPLVGQLALEGVGRAATFSATGWGFSPTGCGGSAPRW